MAETTITGGMDQRNSALTTEATLAPITIQHKVRTDLETSIPKPCKFFFFRNTASSIFLILLY